VGGLQTIYGETEINLVAIIEFQCRKFGLFTSGPEAIIAIVNMGYGPSRNIWQYFRRWFALS